MILDRYRMDGKVAVVTGAGRGIGAATAVGLAQAGADVVISARTAEQLDHVAAQVDGQYHLWLQAYRPQIVVISWGALDDIHAKTPLPTFRATVAHQIALALSDHEVVLIVTPPVTKASYTEDLKSEPLYLDSEMDVARAFHNPNVYVFDVFDQMKQYLTAHHQTYVPYMADGWHPNTLGHALGGQLMFDDMKAAFGKGPIAFK